MNAELNGHEPFVAALESWRDAGVLDAPARIDALSKQFTQQLAEVRALRAELKGLRELSASQVEVAETLAEVTKALKDIAANKSQVQLMLPAEVSGKLEVGPQNVHVNPIIRMDAPVVNVPTELLAEAIGKALGETVIPVLKALAERPVSEVHFVEKALPSPTIEHVHHEAPKVEVQPANVTMDLAPLAEAMDRQAKALKHLAEQLKPTDLSPVLKAMQEQNERIDKALGKLGERPAPRNKKLTQRYDGDWIISEE